MVSGQVNNIEDFYFHELREKYEQDHTLTPEQKEACDIFQEHLDHVLMDLPLTIEAYQELIRDVLDIPAAKRGSYNRAMREILTWGKDNGFFWPFRMPRP